VEGGKKPSCSTGKRKKGRVARTSPKKRCRGEGGKGSLSTENLPMEGEVDPPPLAENQEEGEMAAGRSSQEKRGKGDGPTSPGKSHKRGEGGKTGQSGEFLGVTLP